MLTEGQIFIGGEDLGAKINKQGLQQVTVTDFVIKDMKQLTKEDYEFLFYFFAQFPIPETALDELKENTNVLKRKDTVMGNILSRKQNKTN